MTAPVTADVADEIPDDLFESLAPHGAPAHGRQELVDAQDALLDSLPDLPSLQGYVERLDEIQAALDEARAEAAAIRHEIREKAELLRKVAVALESV